MRPGLIVSILATALLAQSAVAQRQSGPPRVPAEPPRVQPGSPSIEAGPPRVAGTRTPDTLTPARDHNDDDRCPSNRVSNGGFDIITGAQTLTNAGTPVQSASGWTSAWTGPSNATVFSHAAGATIMGLSYAGAALPGRHLAMLVTNANPDMHQYGTRPNAVLGALRIPVVAGTGVFNLTFRTSAISGMSNSYPPITVAVYAVNRSSGAALPAAPATNVTPNTTLYGPGSTRRLGLIDIPASAGRAWQSQGISFNASMLATADDGLAMGQMTHILLIGGMPPAQPGRSRVIGFDAICLQNPLL